MGGNLLLTTVLLVCLATVLRTIVLFESANEVELAPENTISFRSTHHVQGVAPNSKIEKISDASAYLSVGTPEEKSTDKYDLFDLDQVMQDVPLTEEVLIGIVEAVQKDEILVDVLLDVYRNAEPSVARRINYILAETDADSALRVAEEFIYSGDPTSIKSGFELLSLLQPDSDEAREIALGVLTDSNTENQIIAALNLFARPASLVPATQLQHLSDSLELLEFHQNSLIRSHSFQLQNRWFGQKEPVLKGLNDDAALVRKRTVGALINQRNLSEDITNLLFAMAANDDEQQSIRSLALSALGRQTLTQESQLRHMSLIKVVRSQTRDKL